MTSYRKKLACVRVAGPDHRGIIAAVTTFLFQKNINIEDIDQRILDDFLVMNMQVDTHQMKGTISQLKEGLAQVAKKIQMEITFQVEQAKTIKDVALLVTKEPHCLETLVKLMRQKKIKGNPRVVIGNRPDLEAVAGRYKIPFHYFPSDRKKDHEEQIVDLLGEAQPDLIVLARYMQILSPDFCFRYEGKIINIHPSLLPSFPGARAYSQAYHKGVEVVGVTAHFVTTDLDEGPIISQGAFQIDKTKDDLDRIVARGKKLEADVLAKAVKLFCEDRLALRRGKVIDSRKINQLEQKVRSFYS